MCIKRCNLEFFENKEQIKYMVRQQPDVENHWITYSFLFLEIIWRLVLKGTRENPISLQMRVHFQLWRSGSKFHKMTTVSKKLDRFKIEKVDKNCLALHKLCHKCVWISFSPGFDWTAKISTRLPIFCSKMIPFKTRTLMRSSSMIDPLRFEFNDPHCSISILRSTHQSIFGTG